jgi:YhcH/YjgK/YiaL family protein
MIHRSIAATAPAISPARLEMALAFLARADLATLPLGRHDLEDGLFANVQEYVSTPPGEKNFEAHRAYFDVQFVVAGQELIQVAPLATCEAVTPFDEVNDYALYTCDAPLTTLVMRPGDWCVLGPEEAHKPGCALGEPTLMRKVVVKVPL